MSPAGRPEVGKPINIRLDTHLLARVDAFAALHSISRAQAIRSLLSCALGPPKF